MARFGVQECPKMLKENSEKKKTVVFRKRISAKTTVFSVFKSVNLVEKKRRHQNLSAAGALAKVKVSCYARKINQKQKSQYLLEINNKKSGIIFAEDERCYAHFFFKGGNHIG